MEYTKLWKIRYYDNLYRIQEIVILAKSSEEARISFKSNYPKSEIINITL